MPACVGVCPAPITRDCQCECGCLGSRVGRKSWNALEYLITKCLPLSCTPLYVDVTYQGKVRRARLPCSCILQHDLEINSGRVRCRRLSSSRSLHSNWYIPGGGQPYLLCRVKLNATKTTSTSDASLTAGLEQH
eukprot:1159735-Pelagomonas_calceolata.AAC.12